MSSSFTFGSFHASLSYAAHARMPYGGRVRKTFAQRMQSGGGGRARNACWSICWKEKMFVEFRAETREALEAWLKTEGMHFDWMVRVEWETRGADGKLHSAE